MGIPRRRLQKSRVEPFPLRFDIRDSFSETRQRLQCSPIYYIITSGLLDLAPISDCCNLLYQLN
jgi:hypothetical protein